MINSFLHIAHYTDVIMGAIVSRITSFTIVYSTVYSDTDQRKHQCSASLAFVWGIHRGPVNSPHKWPVTRGSFPFDDAIMRICASVNWVSIGSGHGLSPVRRQAITWTNKAALSIGPLGTNFSKIPIEIKTFSFRNMRLRPSSAKWWQFCVGLNVLMRTQH